MNSVTVDRFEPMQDPKTDNSKTVSWSEHSGRVAGLAESGDPLCAQLVSQFHSLQKNPRLSWTTHVKFVRCLGAGGQGIVFLAERPGADGFTLPVAMKLFSPERYGSLEDYDEAMRRAGSDDGAR